MVTDGKAIAQVQWFYFNMNKTRTSEQTAAYSAIFGDDGSTTPFTCPSGDCSWDPYQTLGGPRIEFAIKKQNLEYPSNWWMNNTMINMTSKGDLFNISDVGLTLVNFTRLYLKPDEDVYHDLFETSKTAPEFSNASFEGIETYQMSPTREDWAARYPPTQSTFDPTKNRSSDPIGAAANTQARFVKRSSHEKRSQWLCSLFDGSFSSEEVLATRSVYLGASKVAMKLRESTYRYLAGDSRLMTWKDPEKVPVSRIFQHVAESVTQAIRQRVFANETDRMGKPKKDTIYIGPLRMSGKLRKAVDYEPNAVAMGKVFEHRAVVRVRWLWLLFPAIILLITIMMTISTKIRCSQQGIPAWGSSTMPLMLRGPYSCPPDASMSHAETSGQMERLAKSTKVSLRRTASGWHLFEQRAAKEIGGLGQKD
ncbi:MAG: hypothetical protein Q9221_006167 [Calogaya cf. arnoldii]